MEFSPSSGNYTHAIKTVTITVTAVEVPPPPPPSGLRFRGFFLPVHNLPAVNRVTAGRSIPVKFAVEGSSGQQVLRSGSPTSVPASCSMAGPESTVEETVDGRSQPSAGRWDQLHLYVEDQRHLGRHLPEAGGDPGGWHHAWALFRFVKGPKPKAEERDKHDDKAKSGKEAESEARQVSRSVRFQDVAEARVAGTPVALASSTVMLAEHLDHDPLSPLAVPLPVEHPLPGAQVELARA